MDKQAKRALNQALESLQQWKNSFGAWDQDPTLLVSDEKAEEVFLKLTRKIL